MYFKNLAMTTEIDSLVYNGPGDGASRQIKLSHSN